MLVKVTLKSILINHADPDPSDPDPSGAHWSLYVDLNGYWQLLNKWAPKLTTHVTDNELIKLNRTVNIYVPRGQGVWLQVTSRPLVIASRPLPLPKLFFQPRPCCSMGAASGSGAT